MNKAELVAAVFATGNYGSRAAAAQVVQDVLGATADGVVGDGRVQIAGFGTFFVKEREAHPGRNPRSGEAVRVEASRSVGFRPSKVLKGSL